MVSIAVARQSALALPETEEKSHFQKPDFRVKNKVFAVIHMDTNRVVVKFNLVDQSVFCSFDEKIIYPIPGGWGKKGWTFINMKKVKKSMFLDALATAWKTVAPAKMVVKYFPEG